MSKRSKTKPAAQELSQNLRAGRAARAVAERFDPMPGLTPERLVMAHAAYRRGHISHAVRIWQDIITSDDKLVSVVPNRLAGPGRQQLRYVASEGQEKNPKAQKHIQALKYAYENLRCTDALQQNYRGGYTHLFRAMMQARAFGFSVQEIIWRPSAAGLTATFINIPLQFFEHTTGRLRFLENDFALAGVDMDEHDWLITATPDMLMMATAIARMFKAMPLKDWLIYCEKCAMPGLHGETPAQVNSPEWQELKDSLANFGVDMTIITNPGVKVNPIDIAVRGELAYPALVDRCDRALSSIWLGGDLGSMSRASGQSGGVTLQDKINDQELASDCAMLTSTLNETFDRMIIREVFDEEPLAFALVEPPNADTRRDDIEIDRFLISVGFPVTMAQLASRYGREVPEGADAAAMATLAQRDFDAQGLNAVSVAGRAAPPVSSFNAAAAASTAGLDATGDADLDVLLATARLQLAEADQAAFANVAEMLINLIDAAKSGTLTPEEFAAQAALVRLQLPALLAEMDSEPAATILEETYNAAFAIGLAAAQDGVTV